MTDIREEIRMLKYAVYLTLVAAMGCKSVGLRLLLRCRRRLLLRLM
jgi:hypothetical protein